MRANFALETVLLSEAEGALDSQLVSKASEASVKLIRAFRSSGLVLNRSSILSTI